MTRQQNQILQRIAIGIGVTATAVVAAEIFFATKLGKKTQDYLEVKTMNTLETIKDIAQANVDKMKNSAAHVSCGVRDVIKTVNETTEHVKNDILDDNKEIEAKNIKQQKKALNDNNETTE